MNRIITLALILIPSILSAQINILPQRFNPVSVTLEEFLNFQVLNNSASVRVTDIKMATFLEGKGKIMEGFIPGYSISPGTEFISMNSSSVRILNAEFQKYVSNTGWLPPGRYKVCFNFEQGGEVISQRDQCQVHEIVLIKPPVLITPPDKAVISEVAPLLTWTPPAPLPGQLNVTYSIVLVEVMERQSPVEAVIRNIALYKDAGLTDNMVVYPQSAPSLEEGRQYAWQVTADIETFYELKSGVSSFTIAVPDTVRKPEKRQVKVYAVPSVHLDANYFVAKGAFRFSTENGGSLNDIRIYNSRDRQVATGGDFEIQEVGRDRYLLSLEGHRVFRHKQMYRFEIRDGKRKLMVKFQYLDPQKQ